MTRELLDSDSIARKTVEIVEKILSDLKGAPLPAIIGIHTRGAYLAKRIADAIKSNQKREICVRIFPLPGMPFGITQSKADILSVATIKSISARS